jgi:hypothetical protein
MTAGPSPNCKCIACYAVIRTSECTDRPIRFALTVKYSQSNLYLLVRWLKLKLSWRNSTVLYNLTCYRLYILLHISITKLIGHPITRSPLSVGLGWHQRGDMGLGAEEAPADHKDRSQVQRLPEQIPSPQCPKPAEHCHVCQGWSGERQDLALYHIR